MLCSESSPPRLRKALWCTSRLDPLPQHWHLQPSRRSTCSRSRPYDVRSSRKRRCLGGIRFTRHSRLLRAEKPTFLPPLAHSRTQAQVFPTAAGPVTITSLNHASTLIEAGGNSIDLDPTKAVKFSEDPKADLILITEIHRDHMDPDSIKEVSKAETEILASPAVVQTVTSAKPIANGETKSGATGPSKLFPRTTSFMTRDAAMTKRKSDDQMHIPRHIRIALHNLESRHVGGRRVGPRLCQTDGVACMGG